MSRPEANSLAIREGALAPQSITLELQNGIAHRRCTANHTMTWQQCSWWDDGWQINCSKGADLHGQVSASRRNFFKCHHMLEENGITVNNIPKAFFLKLVLMWRGEKVNMQVYLWFWGMQERWSCKLTRHLGGGLKLKSTFLRTPSLFGIDIIKTKQNHLVKTCAHLFCTRELWTRQCGRWTIGSSEARFGLNSADSPVP